MPRYLIFAIDGTDFEISNTKINRDYFGRSANGRTQNTARATASGMHDLVNIELTKSRINKLKRKYPEFCSRIKSKKSITLRMVKVKISDKTDGVLLTNLLKEEFNTKDISQLYGRRWPIMLISA